MATFHGRRPTHTPKEVVEIEIRTAGRGRHASNDQGVGKGVDRPISKMNEELQGSLAEGVGFEPTVRFPAHTLSKRAP